MKRFYQLISIVFLCVCFANCTDEVLVDLTNSESIEQPCRLTVTSIRSSRLALGEDGMMLYR